MFQPSCILLYFVDIFLVLFQLSLCFSGHHTVISKVTGPGGGGVFLGIHGRGAPPSSPNSNPISDQNFIIYTRLQTSLSKEIMSSLLRLEQ